MLRLPSLAGLKLTPREDPTGADDPMETDKPLKISPHEIVDADLLDLLFDGMSQIDVEKVCKGVDRLCSASLGFSKQCKSSSYDERWQNMLVRVYTEYAPLGPAHVNNTARDRFRFLCRMPAMERFDKTMENFDALWRAQAVDNSRAKRERAEAFRYTWLDDDATQRRIQELLDDVDFEHERKINRGKIARLALLADETSVLTMLYRFLDASAGEQAVANAKVAAMCEETLEVLINRTEALEVMRILKRIDNLNARIKVNYYHKSITSWLVAQLDPSIYENGRRTWTLYADRVSKRAIDTLVDMYRTSTATRYDLQCNETMRDDGDDGDNGQVRETLQSILARNTAVWQAAREGARPLEVAKDFVAAFDPLFDRVEEPDLVQGQGTKAAAFRLSIQCLHAARINAAELVRVAFVRLCKGRFFSIFTEHHSKERAGGVRHHVEFLVDMLGKSTREAFAALKTLAEMADMKTIALLRGPAPLTPVRGELDPIVVPNPMHLIGGPRAAFHKDWVRPLPLMVAYNGAALLRLISLLDNSQSPARKSTTKTYGDPHLLPEYDAEDSEGAAALFALEDETRTQYMKDPAEWSKEYWAEMAQFVTYDDVNKRIEEGTAEWSNGYLAYMAQLVTYDDVNKWVEELTSQLEDADGLKIEAGPIAAAFFPVRTENLGKAMASMRHIIDSMTTSRAVGSNSVFVPWYRDAWTRLLLGTVPESLPEEGEEDIAGLEELGKSRSVAKRMMAALINHMSSPFAEHTTRSAVLAFFIDLYRLVPDCLTMPLKSNHPTEVPSEPPLGTLLERGLQKFMQLEPLWTMNNLWERQDTNRHDRSLTEFAWGMKLFENPSAEPSDEWVRDWRSARVLYSQLGGRFEYEDARERLAEDVSEQRRLVCKIWLGIPGALGGDQNHRLQSLALLYMVRLVEFGGLDGLNAAIVAQDDHELKGLAEALMNAIIDSIQKIMDGTGTSSSGALYRHWVDGMFAPLSIDRLYAVVKTTRAKLALLRRPTTLW